MTAKLHVIQGDGNQRMDACGVCMYSREDGLGTMRCDAFAGSYAAVVRARYPLKCPGYIQMRPDMLAKRPPGWLKRWVLRVLRWVW